MVGGIGFKDQRGSNLRPLMSTSRQKATFQRIQEQSAFVSISGTVLLAVTAERTASSIKRQNIAFTAAGVEHETEHTGQSARVALSKRRGPAQTRFPTTRSCAPHF